MKILMVSIFAPHFFNWAEQLKNTRHEIYWIDVFDSNTKVRQIEFAEQIIGWRYKWDYPGRYFIKKEFPFLNRLINRINERDLKTFVEQKIQEIKPDVVHSFVMYLATAPIFEIMKKHPEIKWIYSSWGSDLYYYRNQSKHLRDMNLVFPKLDFMFSDCYRDYLIAKEHGFKGRFLGVYPGRGGFNLKISNTFLKLFQERTTILIKGYQGKHGRCIPVLKAISKLKTELRNYKLVVFAADMEVNEFVDNSNLGTWDNFVLLEKIPELEVIQLMGEAMIYIGNSHSDGMPNTLLEAIIMGAFPIQSNPGGATAELINDKENGFLINDAEDVDEIVGLIEMAISDQTRLLKAVNYNFEFLKPKLERNVIRQKVLLQYELVEKQIKSGLI